MDATQSSPVILGFADDTQFKSMELKSGPETPRSRNASELDLLLKSESVSGKPPATGEEPLRQALRSGVLSQVQHVLEQDPSAASDLFWEHKVEPPLCYAARMQCSEAIISLLIRAGADVSAQDSLGQTPLMLLSSLGQKKTPVFPDATASFFFAPLAQGMPGGLDPFGLSVTSQPAFLGSKLDQGLDALAALFDHSTEVESLEPALSVATTLLRTSGGYVLYEKDPTGRSPHDFAREARNHAMLALFQDFEAARLIASLSRSSSRQRGSRSSDGRSFDSWPGDLLHGSPRSSSRLMTGRDS